MSEASDYGTKYWAITLVDDETVMLMADRIEIGAGGVLLAIGGASRSPINGKCTDEQMLIGYAPGAWVSFHAASMLDGRAVCVDD
jgi:hypothetical protein